MFEAVEPLHPANAALYARSAARLDVLEQLSPGPALMTGLAELRTMALDSAGAVRATALWSRLTAHCEAQATITTVEAVGAADVVAAHTECEAAELIAHELATAVRPPYATVMSRVTLAAQVGDDLPRGWEALDRGEITLTHLRSLARVVESAPLRLAGVVEQHVLARAADRDWTPSRLGSAARRALIALDSEGEADRAAAAKDCADVRLYPSCTRPPPS